jgi:hypothetical protein
VNGPFPADLKLPAGNGATPNGAVVAYRVEENGDKASLTPAWVSPEVMNPSPASVVMNTPPETFGGFGGAAAAPAATPAVKAGGIVFVLAEGEPGKSHARLYGFDAETGAQIYSSADEHFNQRRARLVRYGGQHALCVRRTIRPRLTGCGRDIVAVDGSLFCRALLSRGVDVGLNVAPRPSARQGCQMRMDPNLELREQRMVSEVELLPLFRGLI